MELTFTPATITLDGHTLTHLEAVRAATDGMIGDYEIGVGWNDRPLIGVPVGHDTVFTVGPYTVTLDV